MHLRLRLFSRERADVTPAVLVLNAALESAVRSRTRDIWLWACVWSGFSR